MYSIYPLIKTSYWIFVFSILSYGFYMAILELWSAYQNHAISFTVDALHLNWNTSFPAITVCEIFNGEKNFDMNEKVYGENREKKLDDFISSISFFSGNCYACKLCDTLDCPKNLTEILTKFRGDCKSTIKNCLYNDQLFECCDAFLPLETEFGICFAINTIFTVPQYGKRLINNRFTGPGMLEFEVFEDVQLHIHSSNEIPYFNEDKHNRETVLWGTYKELSLSITEVFNEEDVKNVSLSQRRCKFLWENIEDEIKLFNYYSYSTCVVQCHSDIQIKFCNCSHQLMPRDKKGKDVICDYKGLLCLTENYIQISTDRMNCDCMISCDEPEINVIYKSNELMQENGSKIKISLIDLPNNRYVRKVIRSELDLVISIGGIAGLYYGASILSLIGIAYDGIKQCIDLFYQFCDGKFYNIFKNFISQNVISHKQ